MSKRCIWKCKEHLVGNRSETWRESWIVRKSSAALTRCSWSQTLNSSITCCWWLCPFFNVPVPPLIAMLSCCNWLGLMMRFCPGLPGFVFLGGGGGMGTWHVLFWRSANSGGGMCWMWCLSAVFVSRSPQILLGICPFSWRFLEQLCWLLLSRW